MTMPTTPAWPASIGQQRHWSNQALRPRSAALNIPVAMLMTGPVDVAALRRALLRVVDRHESLSVRFAMRGDRLVQHVQGAGGAYLREIDLSDEPAAERMRRLREIGGGEARHAFDLSAETPCRFTVVTLAPTEHVLILNVHHIAFDAWSVPVFVGDLQRAYAAELDGGPGQAPPAHRYIDFARWQRRQLASGAFDGQLNNWLSALADPPPPLALPSAGADPDAEWHEGQMCWLPFPDELLAAARQFARGSSTTLFVPLLAAFDWLLARVTGAAEVTVGVPLAARTRPQWEEIVGFFVNTVAIRARIEDDLTFRQLTDRCHRSMLAAQDNQDVPLGVVIDELKPPVTPDRSPLFQAMLILQNTRSPARTAGPLTLRSTKLVTGSARYDVLFSFSRYRDGLALELETRRRFVGRELAERLGIEFFDLLAAALAQPDRPLSTLPVRSLGTPVTWTLDAEPATIGSLFDPIVAHW